IESGKEEGAWKNVLDRLPTEIKEKVRNNPQGVLDALPKTKQVISQSLDHQDMTSEEIVKTIKEQPVTAFFGGWQGHCVAWGYIREGEKGQESYRFFRCNKGDRIRGQPPGVRIHKVHNPESIPLVTQEFKKIVVVKDLFLEKVDRHLDFHRDEEF